MKYGFLRLFLLIGISVLIAGCAPNPPDRPNPSDLPVLALFSDSNCRAGCWHDLRPGVTDEATVEHIVKDEIVFPRYQSGVSSDGFHWYQRGSPRQRDQFNVYAKVSEDILNLVWLSGPFNLTLEDLLSDIGEPDLMKSSIMPPSEVPYLVGILDLDYPTLGYTFETQYWGKLGEEGGLATCLQPDDVIYDVFIYPPSLVEDFLAQNRDIVEHRVAVIEEWPGYECIELHNYDW